MADSRQAEIQLMAIGAILFFHPDEIELEHQMGKLGESIMTIKLTDNGLKNLFNKPESKNNENIEKN